jgi:hypothetical protein
VSHSTLCEYSHPVLMARLVADVGSVERYKTSV